MELGGLTGARVDQGQQPARACPRCNSNNTKFCYFNNYSLTQPRYFCKGCRRYWTHGGTLRNVPVGGSSRKSKRPRASASASSPQQPSAAVEASNNNNNNSAPIAAGSVMMPPPNLLPFHGGGFLSSLVVGQSMSLPAPALQVRPDFAPFGRRDFAGGWIGGDGSGAQFWTLGGNVGGAGEEGGCGSNNPNDQWRNFPAVAGGGNGDN